MSAIGASASVQWPANIRLDQPVRRCAGFGWDRVNFLHSSWYGAMFWICAENSVDNTRDVLVIAEQCLHRIKAWEGTQPGQLTPTDQRDTPDHMT